MKVEFLQYPHMWGEATFPGDPTKLSLVQFYTAPDREIYDGMELQIKASISRVTNYVRITLDTGAQFCGVMEYSTTPYSIRDYDGHITGIFHLDPFGTMTNAGGAWYTPLKIFTERTTVETDVYSPPENPAFDLDKIAYPVSSGRIGLLILYECDATEGQKKVTRWGQVKINVLENPTALFSGLEDLEVVMRAISIAASRGETTSLTGWRPIKLYAVPEFVLQRNTITTSGTFEGLFATTAFEDIRGISNSFDTVDFKPSGEVILGNATRNIHFLSDPDKTIKVGATILLSPQADEISVKAYALAGDLYEVELSDSLLVPIYLPADNEAERIAKTNMAIQAASGVVAGAAGLIGSVATGNVVGMVSSGISLAGTAASVYSQAQNKLPYTSLPGNYFSGVNLGYLYPLGAFGVAVINYSDQTIHRHMAYGAPKNSYIRGSDLKPNTANLLYIKGDMRTDDGRFNIPFQALYTLARQWIADGVRFDYGV